jgi:hypothetical protein
MTNPASTRSAPQPDSTEQPSRRARRGFARALPAGSCLVACLLLGSAAAVDGGAAALVLAGWVALLVVVGMRLTTTGRDRQARRPELILAPLDHGGEVGEPHVVRLVATRAALGVVRGRPRG